MGNKYQRKTDSIALTKWYRALPFWDRVRTLTEYADNGCHNFTGNKDDCGYGRIRRGKGLVRLHRAVWERDHGKIPAGKVICHRCDNPACINPDHLFIGTQVDNIKDMDRKGRRVTLIGSQQSQAKLKEQDVPVIRTLLRAGETCAWLAREYGVSEGAIRHIKKGRHWTHA